MSLKKLGKQHPKAKKVLDTTTGVIYHTVTNAAKAIGMKTTTLIAQLKGQNKNKTSLIYD